MRTLLTLLTPLALIACSGSDDDDEKTSPPTDGSTDTTPVDTVDSATGDTGATTTDTDTGTETVCLNSILYRFPANNSTDAFYATTVDFELNNIEASATIDVTGPSGAVAGTTEVQGKRVRWTADAPLDPSTSYTGTLNWSCAPETTTFTTSATGEPVDVGDIEGQAYRLDLMNGRWLQPAGLGPAIPLLLAADILIGVESDSPDSLDLTFARTEDFGLGQDLCEPTTAFPTATFDANPLFTVGPADVDLEVDGAVMPVYGLELSGAFTADGSAMEGGRLAGLADLGPLSEPLAGSKDPTAVCRLLTKFSVSCLPCPNGGPTSCVQIEVDSIHATGETPGVVTRTPADVAAECF